ncbi:Rhodopsin, GQ-coupled [Trichoplax sp. H2]|nr:Rhodopsin, GQ-coupled [Trichoplax sp. H2]|eukprot:RDD45955.1 Rhodopsin, GQ-coupled [Trichoplax sp. H2]
MHTSDHPSDITNHEDDDFITVTSTINYNYLISNTSKNFTCQDITAGAGTMALSVLLVIITATIGNTVVVIVICKHKRLQTATNYFIVNLAIVDILTAILKLPFYIVAFLCNGWPLHDSLCKFTAILNSLFHIQSTYSVAFIAIVRYIVLFHHSKCRYLCNKTFIVIIIIVSWIVCIALCSLPLMGWGTIVYDYLDFSCQQDWSSYPDYTLTAVVIGWTVPFIIMVACYTKISFGVSRYMKNLRAAGITIDFSHPQHNITSTTTSTTLTYHRLQLAHNSVISRSQLKENIIESKLTKSSFIVCCTFIICYLPYSIVVMIIEPFTGYRFSQLIHFLLLWLKFINSSINPAIYSIFDPQFRKGSISLYQTFRKICCHCMAFQALPINRSLRIYPNNNTIQNIRQPIDRSFHT